MKRILIACALLAGLSGCVTAAAGIALVGAVATGATAGLADYCANTTNESARAKAGCDAIQE